MDSDRNIEECFQSQEFVQFFGDELVFMCGLHRRSTILNIL